MAFLYAGLGIAMISGIAAMMEVANNVSKFNVISAIKPDKYIDSGLAKHDIRFLEIINKPTAPKSDICNYIIDQTATKRSSLLNAGFTSEEIDLQYPIYFDKFKDDNNQEIPFTTNSKNERVQGSCVLINTDLNHRVLINKNKNENSIYYYALFSCYLDDDKPYCNFEDNEK